ncbi:MAG TPA: C1 family peptidase [Phycisphaerae bacterium]|nr:C1 family peptidase [Phycisphaerae bacterium]
MNRCVCEAARGVFVTCVGLVLLSAACPALGQLSSDDIAVLRARGEREGWTFTVGESEATAIPLEQLCGAVEPPGWRENAKFDARAAGRSLPNKWDWRSHLTGYPAIRNQLDCGSCWAFAGVGAMEWALAREAGLSRDLSEQWLVSCNRDGMGCNGGWHTTALNYLTCGGSTDPCGGTGAVLESAFPYVGWGATCNCPYAHPYCLNSWFMVGTEYGVPSVDQIKQAIYDHGPVAVAIYVNNAFQAYRSGIFNACESSPPNHAVMLVGWDDTQGTSGVWILRNQWGTSWGEQGYMRIAYGCSRVGYATAYVNYHAPDCNGNNIPDSQDIDGGTSLDCNANEVSDECEPGGTVDCNQNGVSDLCDIHIGTGADCDANGVLDQCDIASGAGQDCNANGTLDACEFNAAYHLDDGTFDNAWGGGYQLEDIIWLNRFVVKPGGQTLDSISIAWGWIPSGTPTALAVWRDPNGDGDPHDAVLLWKSTTPVLVSQPATDIFKTVAIPDVYVGEPGTVFFIGAYTSLTDDWDRYPAAIDQSVNPGGAWLAEGDNLDSLGANDLYSIDELDPETGGVFMIRAGCVPPDCNNNGVLDECDISSGTSHDLNGNSLPDDCEPDCNGNGIPDDLDLSQGTSADCNGDAVPDECQPNLGPKITSQPKAVTVCVDLPATFRVVATGLGALAYQWRKDGVPIDGAISDTLSFAAVTVADDGAYTVAVTDTCGTVVSAAAVLAVGRPIIDAQPQDRSVPAGGQVEFAVAVSGGTAFTYEWRKDGTPIYGAVSATYAISFVTPAHAGVYDVVIGGCGSAQSAPATLTVVLAAPEAPTPADGDEKTPINVTLAWNPVVAAAAYDVWLDSGGGLTFRGQSASTTWPLAGLAYSTTYRWRVVARAGDLATAGPVWTFTTMPKPPDPPVAPAQPDPPDGATGVPVDVVLSWSECAGTEFYKVLVGEDAKLSDARMEASLLTTSYTIVGLEPAKTYRWRIIAKNSAGATPGPVWTFTTKPADEAPGITDECPDDPDKTEPGTCGCGTPDVDSDDDGVMDCVDNCPETANADQADADTDGVGDVCQEPDDQSGQARPGTTFACPATSTALLGLSVFGLFWTRGGARGRRRHR